MSCSFSQNKSVPTEPIRMKMSGKDMKRPTSCCFISFTFDQKLTPHQGCLIPQPHLWPWTVLPPILLQAPVLWCNLRWRLLDKSHSYGRSNVQTGWRVIPKNCHILFSSNKFPEQCFLQYPVVTQTLLVMFQGLASNAFIFLSSKTTRSRFRTVLVEAPPNCFERKDVGDPFISAF